jgi:hypothetical protein
MDDVIDDVTWSVVREWFRERPGDAYCTACVARDLKLDVGAVRAAMDDLAPRQVFSLGPCGCGATGLRYGWSSGLGR